MKSAKEKKQRRLRNMILLLLLIIGVSIGYAVLSTGLNITGTSKIKNATWDVHFENAQPTTVSNVTPIVAPIASATEKTTTITYTVELNKPGDIYEFTVDVVNKGSVDAKLTAPPTIAGISTEQDAYTNYSFTHVNGDSVKMGEEIAPGESEKFKVRIEYDRNITNEQLNPTTQNLTLTVAMNYQQA